MTAWVVTPALLQLRSEFDEIAPARDRTSDGSIGDLAHQQTSSDHNPDETGAVPIRDADTVNEVHAIDVDDDLREPGLTMEMVVQFLLGRCRSGAEKRLRYMIYNRRIWEASNGWKQRTYTGASPHTEHAHFSGSYGTALEASTASWHLEDLVALTAPEIAQIAKAVWDYQIKNPYDQTMKGTGLTLSYVPSKQPHIDTQKIVNDRADQLETRLNAVEAAQRQAQGALDRLTSDPVDGDNPTVDAVRYANTNP